MKIANTVKKFGKPIAGIVAGLAIAGASAFAAMRNHDEDDYDDDDAVDYADLEADEAESDATPEESTDEPE